MTVAIARNMSCVIEGCVGTPVADPVVLHLPSRRPSSVRSFCRRVRIARGNVCENCGRGAAECQVESHHILEFHQFPQYAKDKGNIVVLS